MSTPLSDDTRQAIERLIGLIDFDDALAVEKHLALFDEALDEADDEFQGHAVLGLLQEVIDWEAGFHVDWKDTRAFIDCLDQLCQRLDIELDWGVEDPDDDDFLDSTSVPELMEHAHEQLRAAGITLWNWNTEADAYAGWLARAEDDEEIMAIAETLGVDIRPGDQPY
jgi:hypothetical protein